MNLIDRYGSYENAKNAFEVLKKAKDFYKADIVNHALKEYRRENNIFEVGDLVVFTVDMSDTWDMEEVYRINKHSHGQYSVYRGDELICWCGDQVFDQEFRHATPEEIKAGRRL